MYKASIISVSEDLIKDVNKLLYGFTRKGNDKIKRTALIDDIENGGLKMVDIQSMILSQSLHKNDLLKTTIAPGKASLRRS